MHMVVAYAHSPKHGLTTRWEPLPVHAHEVGEAAAERAAKFQASSLALAAGLLHDFGKYKPAFQAYLHDPKVTGKGHSSAGALYAKARLGRLGLLLAHVIAGHHAGLQELKDPFSRERLGDIARKLQRYTVGVPARVRGDLLRDGHVAAVREKELGDQFVELVAPGLYKADIGLDWSNPLFMEAADTIVT